MRFLALILRIPFDVIYYFYPELRERVEPEAHELMDVKKYPLMHPKVQEACELLARGLVAGPVPNHVTFHMIAEPPVVIDVYYANGLSPSEKISRLEALLDDAGVDNPYSFSRTRLDAWDRDPANVR